MMMLPALMGYFTGKNTKKERFEILKESQVLTYQLSTIYNFVKDTSFRYSLSTFLN